MIGAIHGDSYRRKLVGDEGEDVGSSDGTVGGPNDKTLKGVVSGEGKPLVLGKVAEDGKLEGEALGDSL